MKQLLFILIGFFQLIILGCVTKFIPLIEEDQKLLVVEGLITDQPEVYSVKLSWSMPVGSKPKVMPAGGFKVQVQDDLDNICRFNETSDTGTYSSDKETFKGVVGRIYTLYINTLSASSTQYTYESIPVEMKAVPPIDSLFYEKVIINEETPTSGPVEGCQIYLNSFDPEGKCRYYRWDYSETWKFEIPYNVENQVCWITYNSAKINIKNTSVLSEDQINRYPLYFISNETDRLSVRYSILVNQYSLSQEEYTYWEQLNNITQDVGSLYDIMPSSIQGNLFCVEDPDQQVLGYFSVSATTTKRIFIKDNFFGQADPYRYCITDTIWGGGQIPGLNSYVWILYDHSFPPPAYRVITDNKGCADCTVRGTKTKPAYW